ncbi:unnamed protein product [Clonostachys chloroleuca]|uniref:Uncharacterized protein n=1 Tax=Clonostachys chloroleuca TaxID=1926264 RepID=A0AA35MC32_9HYPO|nr:unnamed protein product [Clonostachys chloroleuca]
MCSIWEVLSSMEGRAHWIMISRALSDTLEHGLDDLGQLLLVLITQFQDNSLVLALVHEQLLDIPVLLKKVLDDTELSGLLAIGILIDDVGKRLKSGLESINIGRSNTILQELGESLAQSLGRKLGVTGLGSLDDVAESSVKLLGHAGVEGGELSIPLAVGKVRVAEDFDELLERGCHDNRVVETLKNIDKNVMKKGEALGRLGTNDNWVAVLGELANEGLGLLNSAGVIQGEYAENITSLKTSSGLLDELHDTVLLSDQRHVHLHDFNFSVGLASLDVSAVLNRVLDELARARSSQLGGVILLLQQTGLGIDGETGGTDFLLPVDVVTVAVEKDEETTISQGTDTNGALGSIDEQVVGISTRARSSELVPEPVVDEINVESRLEDLCGRNLALLEAGTVEGHALFALNVGLGDGTANNGEHAIRALGSETLGNELIQPACGDGVLLKILGLKKLDEIFDGGLEITTNAQFLESDNHVLARSSTVFTVGEDVTKLTVRVTVDSTLSTNGEVTPHVGTTPEVELMHHTIGRLETLTRIFRGDTAGGRVALGGGAALCLGVDAVEESDITDSMQRKTHGNLKLSCGQIDTAHHFSGGMLNLETRVELEEIELVVGVRVQVLDSTGGNVTDQFTQTDGRILHGLECVGLGNCDGCFFDNLLVTSLNGTVSAKERDVVSVLISQKLHLQMSGIASQLHDEDGGSGNLARGSLVQRLEALLAQGLSDTLTTTTF